MKIKFLTLILIGFLLVACGSSTAPVDSNPATGVETPPASDSSNEPSGDNPYPDVYQPTNGEFAYPPVDSTVLLAYPTPGGDPGSVQQSQVDAIPFKLDKPIVSGATQVTGTGVPSVPILLANVTAMGEVLGSTTVKEDGSFIFDVPALTGGERLGLMIGDLTGTKWRIEDFYDPGFNGDEASNVPMVGYYWDTAMVVDN